MPTLLHFRRLDRLHAAEMLSWRYAPPYELYNSAAPANETAIMALLRPELRYFAVLDEIGRMIAFRCYGPDAQVAGGDYRAEAVDLGGGLRPDLTGQGLGRHVVAAAMNFACNVYQPLNFRVTIAGFNLRAKKVYERLGFRVATQFVRASDGQTFEIMTRRAHENDLSIPLTTI